MPVTKGLVKKLVDQLCTLPGPNADMFDSETDAKNAVRGVLGRAIERNCENDTKAQRVVENLMEGRFRPTAAEIRDMAAAIPAVEKSPDGCEICGGQPWVSVTKRAVDPSGVEYTTFGAKRCDCAKGQWFRQKDRENEAKRKATTHA